MANPARSLWHRAAARILLVAAVVTLGGAWLGLRPQIVSASPQPAAQKRARPPKSLRLYVFDCGKLVIADISVYGFTKDQLATTDMSVACFLIAHPKGTLLWDVGVLPDSVLTSSASFTKGRATVYKPLKAQLAEIGYAPADITYLALSHYHWDHTANANDYASSTWLVEKADRDVMFSDPPPKAPNITPENYGALRTSKTVYLNGADYDVFGDGSVIIKPAPGHTPGHQVLYLKLRKTGPIVLSGDLYHYPEERSQHHVPTTDVNRDQTAASREAIEAFLKQSGAHLWIQHDLMANAKLKKSPAYYE
jgi:N-acyl homoserine lactone hydrolase